VKKILKNILNCTITLCLIVILIGYVGNLLVPMGTSGGINAIKAFHTMEEDSLEVIIYGSSHAWKGCDPMVMYKNHGLGAYNYGCDWQALNTTLLFLEDSLRTQTPKVVCIDTFQVDSIKEDTDMDGQIYYTRAISNFQGKKEYLKQCFGNEIERYISYYVPIIMFHHNWNAIVKENFVADKTVEDYIRLMGYEANETAVMPAILGDCTKFNQKELPEASLRVLDRILEVCEEKGVAVLFFTAPYEGEYEYANAMKEYAWEHDCEYLNLFEYIQEMDINGDTDFRDKTHLNDSGAAKLADFLGEYIVNNYDVTDMRRIAGNLWERNIF